MKRKIFRFRSEWLARLAAGEGLVDWPDLLRFLGHALGHAPSRATLVRAANQYRPFRRPKTFDAVRPALSSAVENDMRSIYRPCTGRLWEDGWRERHFRNEEGRLAPLIEDLQ